MRLAVWAPRAQRVEVELDGRRWPMAPRERGWYELLEADAPAGSDYAFVLDDGKPLPDPRSPWQPQGVHGPSRVVDHQAFEWEDAGWRAPPLSAGVLYELHVGTFTPDGTFDGAIERLDHLVELGITHVELLPVAAFSGRRGWGYDGVALFAPHEAYGGPAGLKRFVQACHRKGLAVVLDVVYNHLGPEGNYLGQFGPYFTDRYGTPWGQAVNLDDAHSEEVRRFVCDNALMWLRDYHVDALRIDAIHAIFDFSATHLLEQMAREVAALERHVGRPLALVAESDLNDPRTVRSIAAGGHGMDAQWSDDFHHALHALLTGERTGYYEDFGELDDLAKAYCDVFVYDGRYSEHRRRRHGRPVGDLPRERFLAYLQNHDQVGNRARGERSSALLDERQLHVAAALVLTSPFVPMLFQGEEWGASSPFQYFTDHSDPELGEAVRSGRRREFAAFGWDPAEVPDPQAPETFERSRLDWSEREREPHRALLDWHRRLIALRKRHPELGAGGAEGVVARADETDGTLVIERGSFAIVANFEPTAARVALPAAEGRAVHLASDPDVELQGDAVHLPGRAVAVLGPVAGQAQDSSR
jgi:maltooligosyltrehalose trehalohydrolase